jgi:hydroxyacylglutathione hydrolase
MLYCGDSQETRKNNGKGDCMLPTALELRTRAVGPWPMNTYVLVCPDTGHSVLIDPGAEPAALREMLAGTAPQAILLTHTHGDHIGALDEMRRELQVPVLGHRGPQAHEVALDRVLGDGAVVTVGAHALAVVATPGHTADMLSFVISGDNRAIVGDTIFDGGPGRTWSAADFQTTLRTLRDVILRWPDAMVCYPGHGEPFRLGERRGAIERFVARDHGDFFGDASW